MFLRRYDLLYITGSHGLNISQSTSLVCKSWPKNCIDIYKLYASYNNKKSHSSGINTRLKVDALSQASVIKYSRIWAVFNVVVDSTISLVPPISTINVYRGITWWEPHASTQAWNTVNSYSCGLVRQWNKCDKPLPVVVKFVNTHLSHSRQWFKKHLNRCNYLPHSYSI